MLNWVGIQLFKSVVRNIKVSKLGNILKSTRIPTSVNMIQCFIPFIQKEPSNEHSCPQSSSMGTYNQKQTAQGKTSSYSSSLPFKNSMKVNSASSHLNFTRKFEKENTENRERKNERMTYYGNWKEPPIWLVPFGGLIATQRREMVIAISPDHTKTMVGVLPRLPISPLAKGYR